jgi:outer membrane cobalamin receptor
MTLPHPGALRRTPFLPHLLWIAIGFMLLLGVTSATAAQPGGTHGGRRPGGMGRGGAAASLRGRVLEQGSETAIEYANVLLLRFGGPPTPGGRSREQGKAKETGEGERVEGAVSTANGRFEITPVRPGRYRIEVSFMGYRTWHSDELLLRPGLAMDLGEIHLQPKVIELAGTETVAERAPIAYSIDKKVVDVGRMETAGSGNAVDVLRDVPSVEVDLDDNVRLRGSDHFTVLIDGRPSILDAQQALQQIPATSIETIEIITNPSAKYDPEGVAGIINIVLHKQALQGVSAMLDLNAGSPDRFGGDLYTSGRRGDTGLLLGANYNKRVFGGDRRNERSIVRGDTTSFLESSGEMRRGHTFYGVRAGIDFALGDVDQLSLGGRVGGMKIERGHELQQQEWSLPGDAPLPLRSDEDWELLADRYEATLDLHHDFRGDGHQLDLHLSRGHRDKDESSLSETRTPEGDFVEGFRSTETGPHDRWILKLDYTLPLGGEERLEAGAQSRLDDDTNRNRLFQRTTDDTVYVSEPRFSYTTEYTRTVHSLYGLYATTVGRFSIQGGIRAEYTDRLISSTGSTSDFAIDRWNWFPSLHTSFHLPHEQQLLVSFSRRIRRPRGWYLEPFITWIDSYTVRRGNPDLKPELIGSYEASYQLPLGRHSLSTELYYRNTQDAIQRVVSLAPDSLGGDVSLHSYANIGSERAWGAESVLDLRLLDAWSLHAVLDLFDYRLRGDLDGGVSERSSFNWTGRLDNDLRLPTGTRLQLTSRYHSSSASAQGERAAYFVADAALKQSFLDRRLSVSLRVRDLFGSGKYDFTSSAPGFEEHSVFEREARLFTLSLSYNFNNFKPQKSLRRNGDDSMDAGFD